MTDENEKKWILLCKKEGEKEGYLQTGPFSQIEVIAKIKSGKTSYSDYIWKEGFDEWQKNIWITGVSIQISGARRKR